MALDYDRLAVLETMSNLRTAAENECGSVAEAEDSFKDDFLAMPEYRRLRDPGNFLILGERGSGKTRVFKTLIAPDGFAKVVGEKSRLTGPRADNTTVVAGYDLERTFPGPDILDQIAREDSARSYWVGSLLITLMNSSSLRDQLRPIAEEQLDQDTLEQLTDLDNRKRPKKWMQFVQNNPEVWGDILDKMDEFLVKNDMWVFVAYDALDRVASRYSDLFPFLTALLSFWNAHSTRWARLRCKIFLRNDLYKSRTLAFPDASKLSSHTIHLTWNTASLYRLLIKRLANAGSPDTVTYLEQIPELISLVPGSATYEPSADPKKMEAFMETLVGKYMGSSPKKGKSYLWPPNHLQDANGALSPRPFLKCFSVAAQDMREHPEKLSNLQDQRLLLPEQIQGALMKVSEERVAELGEEYPWLTELKKAFSGLTMLLDKQSFVDRIHMDLWSDEQKKSLPEGTPDGIFATLLELGIVLLAPDGRVNVPEVYLHGFGMRRKGGLRRPVPSSSASMHSPYASLHA